MAQWYIPIDNHFSLQKIYFISINKDKFPSSADLKVFEAKWEKANELDLTDDIARLEEINKTPALTSAEVNKLTDAEAIQAVRDITEQD